MSTPEPHETDGFEPLKPAELRRDILEEAGDAEARGDFTAAMSLYAQIVELVPHQHEEYPEHYSEVMVDQGVAHRRIGDILLRARTDQSPEVADALKAQALDRFLKASDLADTLITREKAHDRAGGYGESRPMHVDTASVRRAMTLLATITETRFELLGERGKELYQHAWDTALAGFFIAAGREAEDRLVLTYTFAEPLGRIGEVAEKTGLTPKWQEAVLADHRRFGSQRYRDVIHGALFPEVRARQDEAARLEREAAALRHGAR